MIFPEIPFMIVSEKTKFLNCISFIFIIAILTVHFLPMNNALTELTKAF